MRNLLTSLTAAALLLAAAFQPASAEDKTMERTITVSASGTAVATPDEASIQTGVSSEAKTAREALAANSRAMNEVIAKLKASGIETKDIQTSQFSIEPVHAYPQEGQPPVITGYRAHNAVSVKVRNLDQLGEVLDQLVAAGSNEMGGISFGVSKAETLKDDARKEAMANALRRAKLYAAAAGAEVGEIVQISEDTSFSQPRPMMGGARMAMAAEAAPVERGSIDLEARVTATWRLK
jgi:uncharacterized protein YggE